MFSQKNSSKMLWILTIGLGITNLIYDLLSYQKLTPVSIVFIVVLFLFLWTSFTNKPLTGNRRQELVILMLTFLLGIVCFVFQWIIL